MRNAPEGLPPYPGLAGGPVYLDHNATTPVDPRVTEAMLPYLTCFFGNPSSGHPYGAEPRRALGTARAQVAALIGAVPREVVLTASGSEADLLALRGAVLASGRPHPHVITQVTEHPAVLETCRALERLHGTRVTVLPVDGDGLVSPGALAAALDEDTVLVSVMAANNETGALQPITELAALAHRHGALFHCDAAQAAGKIPLDVRTLGVDLLTVVGHKTRRRAPRRCTYATAYPWSRSSTAAARNAGCAPARRTSHWPSDSAPPPTSRPPNSPTAEPRPAPRPCATTSTEGSPPRSPAVSASTDPRSAVCPTPSTSASRASRVMNSSPAPARSRPPPDRPATAASTRPPRC